MAEERLQKILSNAGVASRRVAEELILAGRVTVNGQVQATLGARADLERDEVMVDGVPVRFERYRYFALNKPPGFVTTTSDELGRETVFDLVPIGDTVLHSAGRLDAESEGLLILTNDGHLTDLLTHPRNGIEKEYLVGLDAPVSAKDLQRLVRGIESEGERLHALSARPVAAPPPAAVEWPADEDEKPARTPGAWLLLVLGEGKKREIRRMAAALGREVVLLRRLRIGPLHLGNLGSGAFRELTADEVAALYAAGKRSLARSDETPPPAKERATPRRSPDGASAQARVGPPSPPRARGQGARMDTPRVAPARPGEAGRPAKPNGTPFATPAPKTPRRTAGASQPGSRAAPRQRGPGGDEPRSGPGRGAARGRPAGASGGRAAGGAAPRARGPGRPAGGEGGPPARGRGSTSQGRGQAPDAGRGGTKAPGGRTPGGGPRGRTPRMG